MKSMTKSVVASMLAVCVVSLSTPKANGAATDTITVTVTLDSIISVIVDVATWPIAANTLTATETSPEIIATNDGNVIETFSIKGADGAGAWTLGTPGAVNVFGLELSIDGPLYGTFTAMDTTGIALGGDIAVAGTQPFKMKYTMPTTDNIGAGVGQGFDVVVTAAAK